LLHRGSLAVAVVTAVAAVSVGVLVGPLPWGHVDRAASRVQAPALPLSNAGGPAGSFDDAPGSYVWPVKPFDQSHAVRSTFGDPRTWFDGPPTAATLYGGGGSFSFHQGVDIVVPDGTPVYPVRSGVVTLSSAMKVFVDAGAGSSEQYWHIVPAVHRGQHVVASVTVLGRVRRSYGHVHFTELIGGRAVNPLAAGHLTPYDDGTSPRIGPVELRLPGTSTMVLPELVRGRVEVGVSATDRPDHGALGTWTDMPTVPALITWRVERASDGKTVVGEQTAFDVRKHVPLQKDFWGVYLRGTRQNMPTFKQHRYWRQPGLFVFRLGALDTRRLPDGIYTIVATGSDIRGNSASARRILTIYNHPGWPLPTPQT
jgi:murein DD-endopeptidase MepM/ murein hydrolase activator NlpD